MVDREALLAGSLADLPEEPELLSSELIYDGFVWDVRRERFRFGGEELTRDIQDHPGAVAVLALDDAGQLCLINQYRHPVRTREWELPAGLLDVEGEPPLEAAKRELAEEVDLQAAHWEPLVSYSSSPGGSNEVVHVFLARDLSDSPEPFARVAEEAEIVLRWAPFSDALEAVLAGRIRNAIMQIAVLTAHVRGLA